MAEVCYHCDKPIGLNAESLVVQLQPRTGMRKVKLGVMCEECESNERPFLLTEDIRKLRYEKRYGVDTDGVVTVL